MADSAARRWIGFRPEIRIIDCTIRDGGLMNDHFFEDSTVRRIVQGCAEGGIDFMEIGYKGSKGSIDTKDPLKDPLTPTSFLRPIRRSAVPGLPCHCSGFQ